MNPALILVSGRRPLLEAALSRIRPVHGRIILAAPDHVPLDGHDRATIVRFPQPRFGLAAGRRIRAFLGARWDRAYVLSERPDPAGMENVIAAAAIVARRVFLATPERDAEVYAGAFLARERIRRARESSLAVLSLPAWVVASLLLALTSHGGTNRRHDDVLERDA